MSQSWRRAQLQLENHVLRGDSDYRSKAALELYLLNCTSSQLLRRREGGREARRDEDMGGRQAGREKMVGGKGRENREGGREWAAERKMEMREM